MKKNLIIIFIIVFSFEVNSQIRRGISPFRFNQSMYVGAGVGPNLFLGEGFSQYRLNGSIGMSETVFVGYNFTELIGVRALGTFGSMNWPTTTIPNLTSVNFSTMSMSVDFLLNVTNIFETYNLKRPIDVSVYAGTGLISREKSNFDGEYIGMLLKGGLKIDYRLNYKFDINLDMTGNILNDKFNVLATGLKFDAFPEIKLGVTYHLREGSKYR